MKKVVIALILISTIVALVLYPKLKKRESAYRCDDCNLIIISLSNLRRNNLSIYGYDKKTTPNIDKFFSNSSIVFKNAIAPASLTFTDYISLFFSLQPNKHLFMNRSDRERSSKVLEDHKSLPLLLKNAGYKTAAFVSDEDYAYKNNLGTQFELYFDKKYYPDYQIPFKNWEYGVGTKNLVQPAIKWLQANYNKKFFLFLQAYDLHCPYTPDEFHKKKYDSPHSNQIDFTDCFITLKEVEKIKLKNKDFYKLFSWKSFLDEKPDNGILFSDDDIAYLKNQYDAELEFADNNLNPFFQEIQKLGLDKKTIVVFLSEHGDYLGEAGFYMKASVLPRGNLHNINLGFPLMIKMPGIKTNLIQDQMFQSIDFAPTILEMLNLDLDHKMQGKSHLEVIGKDHDLNDYAYSYCLRRRDYIDNGVFLVESIQNREWKLDNFEHYDFDGSAIEKRQYLYNLKTDQKEENNKLESEPEIVKKLNNARLLKRRIYE